MERRALRVNVVLGLVLLGIMLGYAFRAPLGRAGLAAVIDLATGYRVGFDSVEMRGGTIVAQGIDAKRGTDEVLTAKRLLLGFALRDLLPGGAHRYGVRDLALDGATLTVVRRPDGTFDVGGGSFAGPSGGGAPAKAAAPGTPLAFDARVHDLALIVLDPYRYSTGSRRIALQHIDVSAHVDSARVTKYSVRGTLSTAGAPQPQPFRANGIVDYPGGFGIHHLTVARLPVRDLVNYVVNSESTRFFGGIARNVELRAYSLDVNSPAPGPYHLTGSAYLDGGVLQVPGLQHKLENLHGRLGIYDGGLAVPGAAATIVGAPVQIAGALYGWTQPSVYLGLRASGPLRDLRTLFAFANRLDLDGDVAVQTLVEGPAADPLIVARFAAPRARYLNYPLAGTRGTALYYESSVTLAPARTRYGPIDVVARGTIDLGKTADSNLMVEASAPPRTIPYLAQVMPHAPLHLSGLVQGGDLLLNVRGLIDGKGGDDQFSGFFAVNSKGDGTLGPFTVARTDGASMQGAFYLNRSTSESGFWLDARRFRLTESVPPHVTLPGLPALAPPDFDGVVDGRIVGVGTPANFQVAGGISAHGIRYGAYRIDELDAALAGPPDDVRLGRVRARGPWGAFAGSGALDGSTVALDGRFDGSFEGLAPFTGDLGARGPIHGPVALEFSNDRILVQARGADTAGASVHGVPVDRLDGTLAIAGKRLDVLAANAEVGGGRLAAVGSLAPGSSLDVSLAGLNAQALGSATPLRAGTVAAIGTVALSASNAPTFSGGLALARGDVRGLDLWGNGDVTASASNVALADTSTLFGSAYGVISGDVAGLGTRPSYDLNVSAHDVALDEFARIALPKRHDIAGRLSADLRVAGSGTRPSIAGTVVMPEGTFNGQAFGDARAVLAYSAGAIVARDGTLSVGSTRAKFDADLHGSDQHMTLDVPHADLADFDDLFDTGDTLGGRGHIFGSFDKRGDVIRSNADVNITALRYRRFDLGDARATWASRGNKLQTHVAFGGPSGRLAADGALSIPLSARATRILQRSTFDGTATLRALDLGVWLPVLGYRAPVTGRIDGDATLHGPLDNPNLHLTASMAGGVVMKYPIDRATLTLDSDLHRAIVRRADLDIAAVSLSAAGEFGFRPADPVHLSLHAKTANIGAVASKLVGASYPMSGALEADVRVNGPRAKPQIIGGFDLESAVVHGVVVRRALGEVQLEGRSLVLTGGEVSFNKGALTLAGAVPLTLSPLGLGPPNAPLGLELAANAVDLTDFAPLLPLNSTLHGQMDGRVSLGGTVRDPEVVGDLALGGGELITPYELVPIRQLAAKLNFTSKTVALQSLHFEAGGGTFDGSGQAQVPDFVHPGADATYAFNAKAKALQLDLPSFGRGQIDGTFAVTHRPGSPALLAGNAALSNALIPFSALLLASGGTTATGLVDTNAAAAAQSSLPNLAFALDLSAGNNVRVRSANVDIGGRGSLAVRGALASGLQLSGAFDSTGGTIGYFNTIFRVQSARVRFRPDQGLIPSLNAVATTHVLDPDPNAARNPTGTADITLAVTGPVTQMNIQLQSDPAYDRQTILGLLLNAPAIGATNIFGEGASAPGVPGGVASNRGSGELSVSQEAFGLLNAEFTRTLLAPMETTLGGALGLTNLAFNVDYGGGFGVSARKVLGKRMDLIYAQSFAYPYRQMFGFDIRPNNSTAAQFTLFQSLATQAAGTFTPVTVNPLQPANPRLTSAVPSSGTSGFSFSIQRLFR